MNQPVGWVTYAGGQVVAELLGVDAWRVTVAGADSPAMARTLAALYRDHYKGPQDGYYGQLILEDLAGATNGVAVHTPRPFTPPDTVY